MGAREKHSLTDVEVSILWKAADAEMHISIAPHLVALPKTTIDCHKFSK